MRKLHENKYDNLYYIEPEESIMTALELCDMVVSDESSVMSEAVMFGKPSVAVTDWLIPDTVPSRFASVPMNYVLKCKKVELREYVTNLAAHSTNYNSILEKENLFLAIKEIVATTFLMQLIILLKVVVKILFSKKCYILNIPFVLCGINIIKHAGSS